MKAQGRNGGSGRPGGLWGRLACGWLLVGIMAAGMAAELAETHAPEKIIRLGFSSATFSGVNDGDARAAIKAWARAILAERGVPVDPEPMIFASLDAAAEALRDKKVEAVTLNSDGFWKLGKGLITGPLIGGVTAGKMTEEFVLVVRKDGNIKRLDGLSGHTIRIWTGTRARLAPIWLDTVLLQAGMAAAEKTCRVTKVEKLSDSVLPVFFGKADACLVTKRGFEMMGELNPQVTQRLQVLLTSPPYVPTGFCFRADYSDQLRGKIVSEIGKVKDMPAGRQILNLYQSEALVVQPVSCLDSAFELMETHARLSAGTNRVSNGWGASSTLPDKPPKP